MAQEVKRLTLDLSSGLDLRVLSSSPTVSSLLGMETTEKKKKKSLGVKGKCNLGLFYKNLEFRGKKATLLLDFVLGYSTAATPASPPRSRCLEQQEDKRRGPEGRAR